MAERTQISGSRIQGDGGVSHRTHHKEEAGIVTNRERYMKAINTDTEYKTTIAEFRQWLRDNNMEQRFATDMRYPENDLYDIAVDYSIPVIMVKALRTA